MIFQELQWDEWNEDYIARHGVLPQEVEEAVFGRAYMYKHRDMVIVLGQSSAGRYLLVVLKDLASGEQATVELAGLVEALG